MLMMLFTICTTVGLVAISLLLKYVVRPCNYQITNIISGLKILHLLLGVLRVAVIGLNVILIVVIAAMTVIEVIGIIPVATALVAVLLLGNVLHVVEILLPAEIEMKEMGDEGGAIVDPLRAVHPGEATGTEVVVQRPMIGEETVIVIAMTGMTETIETT